MKVLCSVVVLFLFALFASAQTLSDPSDKPDVTVIQKKWRFEVHNPALDKDPVESVRKREEEERRRKDAERQNEILMEKGMATVPVPMRKPEPVTAAGISLVYIYEVQVRNTSQKKIRALTWEYVFFEPGTEREMGRRQFISKVSIGPGKTKKLVVRSSSPPTDIIGAAKAGEKLQDQYSEKVVIRSIEYADKSVWRAR